MQSFRAILLDIDGTLVDSNDAHAHAWVLAFQHYGHSVTFEQVRALIGKGGDKLVQELVGIDVKSPRGKELEEYRGGLFMRDYLPRLQPFAHVRELLQRLADDGYYLVVATSAKNAEMTQLLEVCGVQDLIHACTSSEDVEQSKPDPDIIHAALATANAQPAESLLLGDTPYDITAAKNAQVQTIALRSGGWDDAALAAAIAIYDDVADLLARYDQSPLNPISPH
jgi:HAD superfamily hydrolase (TIGR01509 family)